MKLSSLFLVVLLVAAVRPSLAAEGTFDRTFPVSGVTNLTVNTGSGYIHVYSGSGNEVHIIGRVHVRPGPLSSDADSVLKRILDSPPISQTGDIIKAAVPSADRGLFQNVAIDYEITAPSSTILDAHTGSGNMEIGGITGSVRVESGSGGIQADNLGANSQLKSGTGDIRATNLHGQASLQTGTGGIELSLSAPGDVSVRTGTGTIHIDGVDGAVQANSGSGSIYVSGAPTSEWRVQSGSGAIHLQVPQDAHFTLNARTGSGAIHSDHPITMTGNITKHHLVGAINGGGPTLRTSTGSGSITVECPSALVTPTSRR